MLRSIIVSLCIPFCLTHFDAFSLSHSFFLLSQFLAFIPPSLSLSEFRSGPLSQFQSLPCFRGEKISLAFSVRFDFFPLLAHFFPFLRQKSERAHSRMRGRLPRALFAKNLIARVKTRQFGTSPSSYSMVISTCWRKSEDVKCDFFCFSEGKGEKKP